jgi:molybdate transport system substrate-binding protein
VTRAVGAALLAAALAGCGGSAHASVTVFAAASLTDAFADVATAFEAAHPDTRVVLNLASSSRLAAQILSGAPADVFASADRAQMERVGDAGLVVAPQVFATNTMVLVTEAGNPLGITGLADLADPGIVVVLAAEEVPAGRYASEVLTAAGAAVGPASREATVRSVLAKVSLGEADAGIVYATDAAAAGVTVIEIPDAVNVTASYPIAVVADAPNRSGAAAFVSFVHSPEAGAILARHGFGTP